MEVPHFHSWKNIEEGYYTKTKLKNELGLKPFDESQYDATAKLYVNSKWGNYVLYHIDNCVEIKKRKVTEHPITLQNIAESLYLINKSAKVSRDTKKDNYHLKNHSFVQAAKTRQSKLYDLKVSVIKKLLSESEIEIKGYHTMFGGFLMLLEINDFTFHLPVFKNEIANLTHLGVLENEISSERTRKVSLNFFEAENLLNRYIDNV
ncbi:YkyB family protein [Lysinibacillus sp. fls2-241-R2A-57]|uniref:YkyB family protein n=1 Tax=Lysinibacillus sp. fls2-241-R2A-57 TaxID=3040292 RepID=UPI002556454B|nr:YkyB family protein [Lysinibacillus sp. fls2-241-R2A-57]